MFSLLRRYVRFHVGAANQLYDLLIAKTRGNTFCFLFNTMAALRGVDVRFSFDPQARQYATVSRCDPRKLAFCHEKQANMAYGKGISQRGDSLGKVYFLDRLEFADQDLVLDCGANVGDFLLWFQNRGLNIRYIGFEPSPKEFGCLSKNVSPHKAMNVGLWSEAGKLDFYVSSQFADSSLIEPPRYDEVISVPVAPLSQYVSERVKLLKLEAEGAEPEILEGLGDKLEWVEYISADLGFERGKDAQSTLVPVVNYLLKKDFSLVDVSHGRICALFRNNRKHQSVNG